ncbi:serine/threonine-protein kinase [Granulicella mallensis]|jgi:tetratricopeptide (TPR) repeat protein|uniref:Serine/threonine-protein kinase n=1 Tax=Granulicella mallensis TaxID=940614 RepID=A0A7W7ZRW5_9BACT|nr:serine/threonine-protein kinase [Granulicella mallensis]MBB5064181.1 serine/threonine-protein kinase [Granulicella mallensis]
MKTILSAQEWECLQEIFDIAAELSSNERDAYLERACAGVPLLRLRIEALLSALESETKIGSVVSGAALQKFQAELPLPGDLLGSYRIMGVVGRGGMGVVYRAVRADDEYQKEVAIKVAALGLMAEELRQRFLEERQILADLDHPHIARLLDGGTTSEGLPYVVMEFVSGQPIDHWCEEQALGRTKRIRLMISVAKAVGYAHQHLVVHRDLKPENIYITGEGEPKLLDFGIAKALVPRTGPDIEMIDLSRIMTPAYASPEQVRGEAMTTATDVYQLGALLYLLLAGRLPFRDSSVDLGALERAICEVPAPSPELDGDLDCIVLRALEKDPGQRYSSANDLADDLERYLSGFPVAARSASWRYRVRKFAGRHKLPVAASVLALMTLIGFSVTMSVQARRIARERDAAERVSDFLQTVFTAADPSVARGHSLSARELLDRGAAGIEGLQADPQVRDRLLDTLGRSYANLGAYDRSDMLQRESLQLRRSLYGEHSTQVADTLEQLTENAVLHDQFAEAKSYAKEWAPLVQSLYGPDSQKSADALLTMAEVQLVESDLTSAEASLRRELQIDTKLHGADSPKASASLNMLGNTLFLEGKFAGAERALRRSLSIYQRGNWQESPRVIDTLDTEGKLGHVLRLEERYAEAEVVLRDALALQRKIQGPNHSRTASTESGLGLVLAEQGQFVEAEALERDALRIHTAALGAESMSAGVDESALGRLAVLRGRDAEAKPLFEHKVAICRRLFGADNPQLARALLDLGRLQVAMGRLDEAAPTLSMALAMEQRFTGDTSPYAAANHLALGRLHLAQDDLPSAKTEIERALSIYRSVQVNPVATAAAEQAMGELLLREGRPAEAQPALEEAFLSEKVRLPAGSLELQQTRMLLRQVVR